MGAHYSKKAAQFLNERNSKFVPRSENPPNTPEIRCSDDFWALIKGEVYKDGWEAENLDQLRIRIFSCFKRADRVDAYRISARELAEESTRSEDLVLHLILYHPLCLSSKSQSP